MLQIMGTLFKAATGGWYGYAFAAVISGAIAASSAVYLTHKLDTVSYQKLQLADANAQKKAQAAFESILKAQIVIQEQEADVSAAAAYREGQAQIQIVKVTTTLTKEVPIYVTQKQDAVACVSYGLVRVLDAAVLTANGTPTDPAGLSLPTGVTDDTCTSLKASDLASAIIGNYGIAGANAEQLNALEDASRSLTTTANTK